jgi:hypothetical protein
MKPSTATVVGHRGRVPISVGWRSGSIATMIHGNPDPADLRKFFRALQRAQRDLDLRPDRYGITTRMSSPSAFMR